jgi:hypothetical protein
MPFATVSEIAKPRLRPPAAGAQVLEILLPAIYLSDHFTAAAAASNLMMISEADLHNRSKFVHHPRQQFWTVLTIFGRRGYDQAGFKDQIWKCWKLLR